jgi:hypothetical protein
MGSFSASLADLKRQTADFGNFYKCAMVPPAIYEFTDA